MLHIQQYLQTHNLEQLTQDYKIIVKQHPKYPELYHFKYNQIESDFSQPITKECRALILNSKNNWNVVARGYDKFWENDNSLADTIDWHTARVYEKADGSYICMYLYDNQWQVCTTGTPDGSGPVGDFGLTFAELFWKTWNELGYELPRFFCGPVCFLFELCTSYNRIIVQHKKSQIILHGARSLQNQREFLPEYFKSTNWEIIKSYPLSSFEECITASKDLNPLESEGYVVCDANFKRIKLKTEQYKRLAHMRDGMSVRRMLEIIRMNEDSEFLSYFPEWKEVYEKVLNRYFYFILEMQDKHKFIMSQLEESFSRKDYANFAIQYPYSSLLFSLLDHKDLKHTLQSMSIQKLEQLIGLKEIKLLAEE